MLIAGELDTNVDLASTMQAANALNNAYKDYDLLFMPREGHGFWGYNAYRIRRRTHVIYRKLLGKELLSGEIL